VCQEYGHEPKRVDMFTRCATLRWFDVIELEERPSFLLVGLDCAPVEFPLDHDPLELLVLLGIENVLIDAFRSRRLNDLCGHEGSRGQP
jgi:hypothetical protein